MSNTLLIGDRAYSSWSLRAWLMFDAFELPCHIERTRLYSDDFLRDLSRFPPTRTVPALRLADGTVVADTLAIGEELATRYPAAGLWPNDPSLRAAARMLCAEMHASFAALRSDCPMNLRVAYAGFPPSDAVRADVARIDALWAYARAMAPSDGPWLFGDYSLADAFYAPVATRIATYDLPVSDAAQAYVAAQLAHPSFRRWRAMALVDGPDQPTYAMPHATRPWTGPVPRTASAVDEGPAENATCPYSGDPVTHFLSLDGRIYGVCNAFCRDKTVADPEAWPEFMALTGAH
ncbi:MAG: glutathione S-transferase [Pseudomonadota bacterium]